MNIANLREKARLGNVAAQTILGICYLDGVEVEADHEEAFRLLSAAAGRGASRAISSLARMYTDGLGVAKDPNEAIRLYEQAARRGEFLAQIALGRMYSSGIGCPVDAAAAQEWYSAALAQAKAAGGCGDEIREAEEFVAGRKGDEKGTGAFSDK